MIRDCPVLDFSLKNNGHRCVHCRLPATILDGNGIFYCGDVNTKHKPKVGVWYNINTGTVSYSNYTTQIQIKELARYMANYLTNVGSEPSILAKLKIDFLMCYKIDFKILPL